MQELLRFAVVACALSGLVAAAEAQGRCSRVSAQGDGLTRELATEIAKVNLGFGIAVKGSKAAGPVSVRCAPGVLMLTSCTASQRACSQ